MILEGYTPRQLEFKTGGPPNVDLMMNAAILEQELQGLEFKQLREIDRDIYEGEYHQGIGAVVQAIAIKVLT